MRKLESAELCEIHGGDAWTTTTCTTTCTETCATTCSTAPITLQTNFLSSINHGQPTVWTISESDAPKPSAILTPCIDENGNEIGYMRV